jgi:creatinine amidohydrolase/Fe(II)-dependent formamide hydrolase-like protein
VSPTRKVTVLLLSLSAAVPVAAQSVGPEAPGALPDPETRRPIPAHESVFIEELTWLEVRDALRDGRRSALIPTGGVELNGPYLPVGRRNAVARAVAAATARLLGDARVAPVIPFAPAVEPGPVSAYPGTIFLSEAAFCAVLRDVATSLAEHGFEEVVLLGDGEASQPALKRAARDLAMAQPGLRVLYVPEFGDEKRLREWTAEQGIVEKSEGLKDDFATSAMLMAVAPEAVRMQERLARGLFSINGISLAPAYTTIARGRELIEHRAEITAQAIRSLRPPAPDDES